MPCTNKTVTSRPLSVTFGLNQMTWNKMSLSDGELNTDYPAFQPSHYLAKTDLKINGLDTKQQLSSKYIE